MSYSCPYPDRSCFLRLLDEVRDCVEYFVGDMLRMGRALNEEDFPEEPLTMIIHAVVTQSWRFEGSWKIFKEKLEELSYNKWRKKSERIECLRDDSSGKEPLIGLEDMPLVYNALREIYSETGKEPWKEKAETVKALEERLRSAGSLRKWVSELYGAVSRDPSLKRRPECLRGVKGIGPKGALDIVRSLSYFDVAPIDVHEMRFLLRTGIACRYGSAGFDPRDRVSYLDVLRNFCREELGGVKLLGLDLGESPGVVDSAIWYFCSQKGKNLCGSVPRCDECVLRDCCLYWLINNV